MAASAGYLGGGGGANRDEAAEQITSAVSGQVIDIQIEAGPGVTLIDYITSSTSSSQLPSGDGEIVVAGARSAHDVLGVEPDVIEGEIRAAYQRRVQNAHPDKPGGDEEMFKQVNAAKEKLTR